MLDIKYCYLNDVIGKDFSVEWYNSVENLVNILNLNDPDRYSKKLYDDLLMVWNGKTPLKIVRYKSNNLKDQYDRRYSSDYIGPSVAWAKVVGMTNLEIGTYVEKARTIGGHVIWPLNEVKGFQTINTARGGRPLYDRIDLALYELRRFYCQEPCVFSPSLRKAFEREKEWLNILGKGESGVLGFKNFIDMWKLNPFIDEGEYTVLSLGLSDLACNHKVFVDSHEATFPGNKNSIVISRKSFSEIGGEHKAICAAYRKYVENNIYAIEQRNKMILNSL